MSFLPFLRLPLWPTALVVTTLASPGCESSNPATGVTDTVAIDIEMPEDFHLGNPDVGTDADPDTMVTAPDGNGSADVETSDVSISSDTDSPSDTALPTDSDNVPDTTPDVADPMNPVLPDVRPPVSATHTATLSAFNLEPGRETTRCVVKRLDNPDVLWVSEVQTQLAPGSHHLIVYKSDATEEQPTPFECDPFVETLRGETFPLMITQIRSETLSFPNGVAFRFEPNQMVRLEAHYLNYFPQPIEATATVHFRGIAASNVVSEANMLFYGTPDFRIPANSTFTTPWRFLSVLPGTRVFALTGHTHTYGTNVEVEFANHVETPGTHIYPGEGVPFVWDEPPVARYEPALRFNEGEGFRYRCSWNNTTNQALPFGESANEEMCFFWAYYYPSQGYRICISPGSLGGGIVGDEVCCPGHWACGLVDQYL